MGASSSKFRLANTAGLSFGWVLPLLLAGCVGAGDGPRLLPAAAADVPPPAVLAGLQPAGRWFNMGYHGSDVPVLLQPTVRDLRCQRAGGKPLRLYCDYTLTVGDWIGSDPPVREVRDLLARDAAGKWIVLLFDAPGLPGAR